MNVESGGKRGTRGFAVWEEEEWLFFLPHQQKKNG